MSGDNLQEKSFYDSTKNPDTLSSVHQQDNDDNFCTRRRKCARNTRHASSQPNDVIELSSGSEGEDECIVSNSTSFVSGSAAAAASTPLDSTQDHHHDFAGDFRPRDFGGTSQSGGMTSGRSGHTSASSMSGVASATATSTSAHAGSNSACVPHKSSSWKNEVVLLLSSDDECSHQVSCIIFIYIYSSIDIDIQILIVLFFCIY